MTARSKTPLPRDATADIGEYRLATRIAVGGMAEVFRALKRQAAGADRAVVIKRMLPALLEDPECRAMFEHEARLGLRIRHDNVVDVIEHSSDGEAPYIVLEYVFGVDLRRLHRWMARSRKILSPSLAVWITTQLLSGLHAVHGAKDESGNALHIVHRDVSPSNVFISVHGDVKLGDLGIAQAALRETRRAASPPTVGGTRAANAKGKLGYLAPEQVAGLTFDARSDVFAAAAIAAELVLGRPLFAGGTEIAVLLAIRDADVTPLRALAGRLPKGLVDVLLPALAREPEQRTPDADTFRRALLPFVESTDESLRRELGALTVGALDAGDAEDSGKIDRTSLARTVEADGIDLRGGGIVPPRSGKRVAVKPVDGAARLFDLDSPGVSHGPTYEVRAGDRTLGPWPYSRVVQALHTAEIDAASEVRIAGGAPRAIGAIPELARHLPPSSRTPSPLVLPMARTNEVYDLGNGGILGVLVHALRDRESGLLLCEHDGVRKEIYLDRGVPTFVTSNRVEELLGERLVADRVVDRGELDLALAVMPRFEGRLGDTLVALGLVEPIVLFRHIASQVREKLLEVFAWRAGRGALYRGVDAPERSFPLDLDPWDLLEAGVRRRSAAGFDPASRHAGRILVRASETAPDVALPEHLRTILELVEGAPRSLDEVAHALGPHDRTRAGALLLVELGALRFEG